MHQLFYEKIKLALACKRIIDSFPTNHHLCLIIIQFCSVLPCFSRSTTAKNNNIGGWEVWETMPKTPTTFAHWRKAENIKLTNSLSKCETQAAFKAFEVESHLFPNLLWKIDEERWESGKVEKCLLRVALSCFGQRLHSFLPKSAAIHRMAHFMAILM